MRLPRCLHSAILIPTILLFSICNANVYVTQPASQTQWAAGTSVNITWEEDGHHPTLESLGHTITISLYPTNKGLYPKPLQVWKNVDARSQFLNVRGVLESLPPP